MSLAVPRSLSPSKVSAFTSCPLAFRFSIIDRLPEPSSPEMVKGTLVHLALERLFWHHAPGERTLRAALAELAASWEQLRDDPDAEGLELSSTGEVEFLADAEMLVRNYFALEDPDRVRAVGVELGLEVDLGATRLRGIIDRLDVTADGRMVVIDYKTGRAPPPRHEHGRLSGVHLYSLLCRHVLGRTPDEVRLLYLRDPMTIAAFPSPQSVRGQERRTLAVWSAIERACVTEDFRPNPSALCRTCHFQPLCPAFGGTLPEPQSLPQTQTLAS